MASELEYRSLVMAKDIAPKDTNNLALNAISSQDMGGEDFAVRYNSQVAPYIDNLEFGTKEFDGHRGFIELRTVDALIGLIHSTFNGGFESQRFSNSYERVNNLEYTEQTNETLLKAIGGVSLVPE